MSGIRFVKYTETPDSHQAGIATIEFTTKILLPNAREERSFVFSVNYKVVAKKDNSGFFPAMASYKIAPEGPGNYLDSFELDSSSMKREIEQLIMEGFKSHYSKPSTNLFNSSQTKENGQSYKMTHNLPDELSNSKSASFVESPLPF